jgi:hypothetical protein
LKAATKKGVSLNVKSKDAFDNVDARDIEDEDDDDDDFM